MAITIRNLTLSLDEPEDRLRARAARRLRVRPDEIQQLVVTRRAIDARDRGSISITFNIEVLLRGGEKAEQRILRSVHRGDVGPKPPVEAKPIEPGIEPLPNRPVIVGFGPAGMFAALWLARHGYRPLVIDRGQAVRTRHRDIMQRFYREHDFDSESNLLFGEGGAGAYSDGKLYTRVHDPRTTDVLRAFVEHGAPPESLIESRPHLGSDRIPTICTRIRGTIESLGGEIRFGTRLDALDICDGIVRSLRISPTDAHAAPETIAVGPLLLGIGHSARDTIRMLIGSGVKIVAKPFQLGVRVEHPQAMVDRWQYGPSCGHASLPPAEYHLVSKGAALERGDVFSFCMCPGGLILPTNESPGLIATNGASGVDRSGPFANAGLVVTIGVGEIDDDPLRGLSFLEGWERAAFELTAGSYRVPAQRGSDYVANRPSDGELATSYPFGGTWADVRSILPATTGEAVARGLKSLDARMPGFAGEDSLVTGPESRASAPVRILRDERTRESVSTQGLYPMGEGAGYAGGIVSAAVDGIRTAEVLIGRYAPMK